MLECPARSAQVSNCDKGVAQDCTSGSINALWDKKQLGKADLRIIKVNICVAVARNSRGRKELYYTSGSLYAE